MDRLLLSVVVVMWICVSVNVSLKCYCGDTASKSIEVVEDCRGSCRNTTTKTKG